MPTELNIKITAETAEDAMIRLSLLGFRAAQELGSCRRRLTKPPTTPQRAAEAARHAGPSLRSRCRERQWRRAPPAKAVKPKGKRAAPALRSRTEPKVDRETVLDEPLRQGLSRSERQPSAGAPARAKDSGAERLRDLKEEDIPEADALLVALRAEVEAAP